MLRFIPIFIAILFASSAMPAPQSSKLEIDTMTCGPDLHAIKAALLAVKGVDFAEVSLEQKTATVTFDNAQTNFDALIAATGHAGLPILPKP